MKFGQSYRTDNYIAGKSSYSDKTYANYNTKFMRAQVTNSADTFSELGSRPTVTAKFGASYCVSAI